MARLRDGPALVTFLLCIAAQAQATAPASPAEPNPDIRWSEPIDGLSLGIEVPERPIRFVGYSDWKGPLQVWRDHGNGRLESAFEPRRLLGRRHEGDGSSSQRLRHDAVLVPAVHHLECLADVPGRPRAQYELGATSSTARG